MDHRRLAKIYKANGEALRARLESPAPEVRRPDMLGFRDAAEDHPPVNVAAAAELLLSYCPEGALLARAALWGELQNLKFGWQEIQEVVCQLEEQGRLEEQGAGWLVRH